MIRIFRRRRAYLLVSGSLLFVTAYLLSGRGNGQPTGSGQSSPSPKKPASPFAEQIQKPIALNLPAMQYGTNARPPLKDLATVVGDLPTEFIPSLEQSTDSPFGWPGKKPKAKRLVIVGDVHGQLAALKELLKKIDFSQESGDHLILAGDLVNKGPDSAGVVQLAMDLGASAVRGNHDDRLLLTVKAMRRPDKTDDGKHAKVHTFTESSGGGGLFGGFFGSSKPKFTVTELSDDGDDKDATKWDGENGEPNLEDSKPPKKVKGAEQVPQKASRGDEAWRALAATLSEAQIAWLESLPVILRIGRIPGLEKETATSLAPWNSELVVVHAGLVPSIPLEKQDPWAVMHIRSLKYPADAMRRSAVKKYLQKVAKQRNRGRPTYVSEAQVDLELKRLKKELPAEAWSQANQVAVPDQSRDGDSWSDVWNEVQNNKVPREQDRMTVIYGHDAKQGLNVDMAVQVEDRSPQATDAAKNEQENRKGWFSWFQKEIEPERKTRAGTRYAFGLDSGCVYGKQLTAMILEAGLEGERGIVHRIIQVNCQKAAETKEQKKAKT